MGEGSDRGLVLGSELSEQWQCQQRLVDWEKGGRLLCKICE